MRRAIPLSLGATLVAPAVMAFAGLATPAAARDYPTCAGSVEVADADIVRVENDGVLVLRDGRAADLEGVILPDGAADRAASLYKRQAVDAVRDMVVGHHVTLLVERPKEDRYGRLRAQVYVDGHGWVQDKLLAAGLARVDIQPDRPQCAGELYAAERQARNTRIGLWASPAYAVKAPDALRGDTGTFQIVEGTIKTVSVKNGRAYFNFGDDWRHDFTATVAPDDLAAFRKDGDGPYAYEGARVRVRGWVESMNGPEIQIAAPQAIEVLSNGR